MRYFYTGYSAGAPVVIFKCEAEDILDADRQLETITGIVAKKISRIGVWIPDWRSNSQFKQ